METADQYDFTVTDHKHTKLKLVIVLPADLVTP